VTSTADLTPREMQVPNPAALAEAGSRLPDVRS
jgi:hypothetical protein